MDVVIKKAESKDSAIFARLNCGFWNASYLNGKYYYIHLIHVSQEFRNRGIGGLLFKAQLTVGLEHGAEYVCAVSLEKKIPHWIKYGFEEYGESQYREHFGILKWLKMKIR